MGFEGISLVSSDLSFEHLLDKCLHIVDKGKPGLMGSGRGWGWLCPQELTFPWGPLSHPRNVWRDQEEGWSLVGISECGPLE